MIQIIKYIKKYLFFLIPTALACVGVSLTTVMLTDLLKSLVDEKTYNPILMIIIIIAVGLLSNFLVVYLTGFVGANLLKDLRKDCLSGLMKASPCYISAHNNGDILERVSADVEQLADFVTEYFKDCLYVPIMVCVYSIYLFRLNALMALCCLLPLVILVPINIKFMKPVKLMQFEYSKKLGFTNNNIQEAFDGASTIKAYNLQDRIKKKYYSSMHDILDISNKTDLKQYNLEPISRIIQELPVDIALVLGGILVFNSKTTIGTLIAYISVLRSLVIPLSQCYQLVVRSQTAIVSISRVFEVINITPERNNSISVLTDDETAIEFADVSFKYKSDGNNVLNNISFKIRKGSHVAFVGKSGNGKSTILKLIATFLDYQTGDIRLFGHSYCELSPQFIRSKIAYVSQDSILFPMSVYDNIRVGNPNATAAQIETAIKNSGCREFQNVILAENGCNLSGGQRQRLSIARALVKDADIYLFDEPTSALDYETERIICKTITSLSDEKTVITVTHKLSTVKDYDYIFTVKEGSICRN
ncbi:MAG: ABC transporter ATP-binding protein [Lachnospira sp.]